MIYIYIHFHQRTYHFNEFSPLEYDTGVYFNSVSEYNCATTMQLFCKRKENPHETVLFENHPGTRITFRSARYCIRCVPLEMFTIPVLWQ